MPPRLALCGRLYSPWEGVDEEGCIIVDQGRGVIEEIRGEPPGDAAPLRAGLVLPGLVDMHVHLRGLRLSYKEDEETGGLAAARGGLTLVADMPNTLPRLDDPDALRAKLEALKRSPVEALVYAAVPPSRSLVDEVAGLPGVAGFKVYPWDLERRAEVVEEILSRPGLLVVLHPELPEAEKPVVEDAVNRAAHRGCHWELAAVEAVASLSPEARVHVTHASCPSTVEAAKKHGFTVDVTPHHLPILEGLGREPCLHRVNPPIRGPHEAGRLLGMLLEGLVDAVASDHAPHSPREKSGDPLACPPGIAWLEAWPGLLYCLVEAGALGLSEFLELASRRPAEILGVERCISPGCPASLTLAEPGYWRFDAPRYSKAKLVPYVMERTCWRIVATVSRGRLAYAEQAEQVADE